MSEESMENLEVLPEESPVVEKDTQAELIMSVLQMVVGLGASNRIQLTGEQMDACKAFIGE